MKVIWTRRYLIELQAIGDFIADRNPRAAARVVNDVHSKKEFYSLPIPSPGGRGKSKELGSW